MSHSQILLLGDPGAGKTTLLRKLTGIENSSPLEDYVDKKYDIGVPPNQETVHVRFYDPRFDMRSTPTCILRQKDIVILVWSLTDDDSFRNIGMYMNCVFGAAELENSDIVLCANKCDENTDDRLFDLCKEHHVQYPLVKTSLDGTGIQELESILLEILGRRHRKRDTLRQLDSFSLHDKPRKEEMPRSNCC